MRSAWLMGTATIIANIISKIAFVITDKGDEISKNLVSTSPRGVTIIDVVGAYTFENKKMLFCALKGIVFILLGWQFIKHSGQDLTK